ncbi:MAG: GntR family transcriptional regulator [Chloroflexota bacterium]|nr:GntR family transcriptional regulator [Chloroflexota bacterium]
MPTTSENARTTDQNGISRFDRAYRLLREAITEGTYRPNQRLTEIELAQALGVSRPTVRGVLVRLEQEGMVVMEPNRGASVRSFGVSEALSILRLREVLEGLAAALAAERATADELDQMADVIAEMERLTQAGDLLAYSGQNAKLHRIIVRAARDELLEKFLNSLNYPLIRYQFRTILVPGRKDVSLKEHQELVRSLKERSAAEAERAMRFHIGHVRETLEQSAELLA